MSKVPLTPLANVLKPAPLEIWLATAINAFILLWWRVKMTNFAFLAEAVDKKIAEFAPDDTPVVMVTKSGKTHETTIGELLPNAFRAHDLGK